MDNLLIASGILGPCLAVWGLAVLFSAKRIKQLFDELKKSITLSILFRLFMFVSGLLLVRLHNDFSTTHAAIVSFFSWSLILKGTSYLLPGMLQWKFFETFFKKIPVWGLMICGAIVFALEVYIAYPAYL